MCLAPFSLPQKELFAMSSGFQDLMKADASSVFANPNDFGETATIVFVDGTTRAVNVIVDRHPAERIDANGMAYTPTMIVHLANDATTGISSAELDASGVTKMLIAERIGGTPALFGIYPGFADDQGRTWMDNGMLKLELK